MSAVAYRLPTHVRPRSYAIDLSTDPSRPDFEGSVSIALELAEANASIEMHARDLVLSDAVLHAGGHAQPLTIVLDPAREIVRFIAPAPIPAGAAKLDVRFSGKPSPGMHGLYLASDGKARAICTQCEATDARAIFPCFDEPEFKATLEWTLRTSDGVTALSNGALAEVNGEGTGRVWRFEATRPVSSYLAALVVGNLEGTEPRTVDGVPLRVFATRGKLGQTRFALDFTAKLLPWYERYFGVRYPYGKYDQVAVPGFDAGAMENVGLVLFRQNLLLMDPGTASWRQEKVIAKVIAHEFAHMWFGNLVTMRWWDDLWLNEAFAEWMAHKATDAQAPDYRVWEDFQDDKNRALIDDAMPATHPIWTPVETPEQAIEMFDVITYQKGCAVMRMLENFLGEGPFMNGLRSYMQAYAEKNAAGPDLWRELERASGEPVAKLMESWVAAPGFPLLDCALTGTSLRVSQKRFYSSPEVAKAPSEQRWSVPVVVRYEDSSGPREHRFILGEREQVEQLPANGPVRWCYPNASEIGFYRVRGDSALRAGLLGAGLSRLSAVELMGVLEDQWALVRNATDDIGQFLDVVDAYATGPISDHNVLRGVVDRMGTIDLLLKDSGDRTARAGFRRWVGDRLSAAYVSLGDTPRSGEPQNDVQRRALLIHAMGRLARDPTVISAAERHAAEERADPQSVDPNLAGTFLGLAAMFGDELRYDEWIATYRARKEAGAAPQATLRYLYTLASFRPEPLTRRTLGLLDDGTVPQEAVGPLLSQLLASREAQRQAWEYLQSGWGELRPRIGDMGLSRLVESVGALPHAERASIVRFFEAHPPAGAERALARALEGMDEREELRTRVTPALLARFKAEPA